MSLARVTIAYPNAPGAPFRWEHYVPKHLPLAVGTSMRHAQVTGCHCDRPAPDAAGQPYACLCIVEFASPAAMDDFRAFFATGHPETARILADEPNYTTITPLFMAGLAELSVADDRSPAACRVRLLFPTGGRFDPQAFERDVAPALAARAGAQGPVCGFATDRLVADVPPGSRPACEATWSVDVADRAAAARVLAALGGPGADGIAPLLAPATDIRPQVLVSDIVPFDLRLAEAVARAG